MVVISSLLCNCILIGQFIMLNHLEHRRGKGVSISDASSQLGVYHPVENDLECASTVSLYRMGWEPHNIATWLGRLFV